MKLYKLEYKICDNLGFIPSLAYDEKQVEYGYYKNLIPKKYLGKLDEPVFLKFTEESADEPLQLRDAMFWSSGNPMSNLITCSTRLKQQIEKLSSLPLFRFYPAKVRKKDIYLDYWVFHYLHSTFSNVDFEFSLFGLKSYKSESNISHVYNRGEITSHEHIMRVNEELFDKDLKIIPIKLALNSSSPYDIWSLYGQHIISAKAMLLFEEAGITGIDMIPLEETEWKNLEIVMKPTDTITVSK